ncbi:MAG TPA: glycogen/starch/alpha-glucan phosphorylase [Alphaproteobacteria bacterium]|nr:glycogen/starch/alpha-glucan phosphorylase [Alphaproteobacteria bacterium]
MEPGIHPPGLGLQGLDKEALKKSFLEWLVYSVGKDPRNATDRDWFASVALAVRDRVVDNWMATTRSHYESDRKRVYYLSLEFLIGRLLNNNMSNLGIVDACREALAELGVNIDAVVAAEPDQALGNGGLGRLAACFLDSMATLGIAGYGYGIRYEYGMFEQRFDRGWQVEYPENWLDFGNPWEFERPEVAHPVDFYGHVEEYRDADGERRYNWVNTQRVNAMAYDTPVVGWKARRINTLRLWSARPTNEFNLADFNSGNYLGAVEQKVLSENLSRVLYPNDATEIGQELRFKQEYFFTSASLQDILRRYVQNHEGFDALPEKAAIQLNDTHPAIAVPELMRLLVDKHGVPFARAWELTQRTISYTNHTLLPEALEAWPVRLVERVLPRHMQIIYEINARFLQDVRRSGIDNQRLAALSLIDENGDRRVRMGNLAFLGSHRVNGVSALHTDLMKQTVFHEMHRLFPDRITNKTNGITPRRWLNQCNPGLSRLVTETIGDGWVDDLERLSALNAHADDAGFRTAFAEVKRQNKRTLAEVIGQRTGIAVDPAALFDVQIKRIHEYKRQLLNLLQTVALYNQIRDNPMADWLPRVKVFGGKAASSYAMAKLIIKLGNDIARVINQDPAVRDLLKVVFLPNYNVTLAERIIPAADLSEQISTAGKEASGTGNMKFALNGALTIGTLDGANVEIKEQVGDENIFIFGLTAPEAAELRANGDFDPRAVIEGTPMLKRVLDMIGSGVFSPDDPVRFRPIVDSLYGQDTYLVTADFAAYVEAQKQVGRVYSDQAAWMRKAVLNTAGVGWFSSDRTVRQYAEEVWHAMPPLAEAAE